MPDQEHKIHQAVEKHYGVKKDCQKDCREMVSITITVKWMLVMVVGLFIVAMVSLYMTYDALTKRLDIQRTDINAIVSSHTAKDTFNVPERRK